MRVTFDREANAAYIAFCDIADGMAVHSAAVPYDEVVNTNILLDFDSKGRFIGIEITGAKTALPQELLDEAEIIG